MALGLCPECQAQVSKTAKSCPRCGANLRGTSGCAIAVILLIVVITLGFALEMQDRINERPEEKACRSDFKKCADNLAVVKYFLENHSAQSECRRQAAALARYGEPKYSFGSIFETFLTGTDYARTGVATLIENNAQFQNEYGAMVHAEVRCDYDLRTKHVVNIQILPR